MSDVSDGTPSHGRSPVRRAFVLSGGASLGAVQVGMLLALFEQGIMPDIVIGASVGALNGAAIADEPTLERVGRLADLWRSLTRDEVFPTRPLDALWALAGKRDGLVSSSGIEKIIRNELKSDRFEDLALPLKVVTVEITSGAEIVRSHGDVRRAVLASAAIPGILAPVTIDGLTLVDGGIGNNTPVSVAIAEDVDEIWVLACGFACALSEPPKGPLAISLQALSLLIGHRLASELNTYRADPRLRLVPPLCPLGVQASDFRMGGELIDRAHASTLSWLASGAPDGGDLAATPMLTPHSHSH